MNETKRDKRIVVSVTQEEKDRILNAVSRTVYESAGDMCRTVILGILPTIEDYDWKDKMEFVIENKGVLEED